MGTCPTIPLADEISYGVPRAEAWHIKAEDGTSPTVVGVGVETSFSGNDFGGSIMLDMTVAGNAGVVGTIPSRCSWTAVAGISLVVTVTCMVCEIGFDIVVLTFSSTG